jgi:hypothetical protein
LLCIYQFNNFKKVLMLLFMLPQGKLSNGHT